MDASSQEREAKATPSRGPGSGPRLRAHHRGSSWPRDCRVMELRAKPRLHSSALAPRSFMVEGNFPEVRTWATGAEALPHCGTSTRHLPPIWLWPQAPWVGPRQSGYKTQRHPECQAPPKAWNGHGHGHSQSGHPSSKQLPRMGSDREDLGQHA